MQEKVVTIFVTIVTKYITETKEGEFALAHSFRQFGPWWLGFVHLSRTVWRQEYIKEEGEAVHVTSDRSREGIGRTHPQ